LKLLQVPPHSIEDEDEAESNKQSDSANETEDSQDFDADEDDLLGLDSKALCKILADEVGSIPYALTTDFT
jgi:hypothetical protein